MPRKLKPLSYPHFQEQGEKCNIVWECPSCEHQMTWHWNFEELTDKRVFMLCEKCAYYHDTKLIPMGANTWAAIWKPFNLVKNTLQGARK